LANINKRLSKTCLMSGSPKDWHITYKFSITLNTEIAESLSCSNKNDAKLKLK